MKQKYHRIRLILWAIFNLPRKLWLDGRFVSSWKVAELAKKATLQVVDGSSWFVVKHNLKPKNSLFYHKGKLMLQIVK
jgi:hypothetical protein